MAHIKHRWRQLGLLTTIPTLSMVSLLTIAPLTPAQTDSTDATIEADAPRFTCELDEDGQYTVMYTPESQPDQSYPWATPGNMGGGWSADRRCAEISRRLEAYRPDGLIELQSSVENGYDTVCVTTEDNPTCRIVFTVPPGQDPLRTRDRVFDNIAAANSGESTTAVTTFRDGDQDIVGQIGDALDVDLSGLGLGSGSATPTRPAAGLSLKPFLDRSDRGTGALLRPSRPAPRLNPGDFR